MGNVKNYKYGNDVILMLQPTCLFCVVNKNMNEVLIKMKKIFFCFVCQWARKQFLSISVCSCLSVC